MEKGSFGAHPIWASVEALAAALSQAEAKDDPSAGSALNEVRYLLSLIRAHADATDTAPYSSAALNAVNSNLPNTTQEVANFVSNGNPAHATNAAAYADAALHQVGTWPTQTLKGGAAAVANRLFVEYREAAAEAVDALRVANRELADRLTAQNAEYEVAISTLRSEIANLTSKITADETRLDTALTTNNEAFTAKQTEREEKFKAFVDEQGNALQGLATEHLNALKGMESDARDVYTEIDALRKGTENVAGLASADILAGKFQEYSGQQWKWGVGANILGFVALTVGLGVIGWTLQSVGAHDDISWQYTVLKLGVTVTIVAASAVAFRLGGIFLSRSSTSKRMELELRAIGPFFADVEDTDALKDAKKAFVERSFGHGWGEKHGSGDAQLTVSDTQTLLSEITELLKTVTSRNA